MEVKSHKADKQGKKDNDQENGKKVEDKKKKELEKGQKGNEKGKKSGTKKKAKPPLDFDEGLPIPDSLLSENKKRITINEVFHPTDPPDVLDTKKLARLIYKDPNFWSRDEKPLSKVAADFGRAHYIFTKGTSDIPTKVHTFCYQKEGTAPSNTERVDFFASLGIKGETVPALFDSNTPQRACGITRVKYEIIRQYLAENGFKKKSKQLAVHALYLSTQDYLSWIKTCTEGVLKRHFPELNVGFAFFQSSVVVENGKALLKISLLNHIPSSGSWQCKFIIPTDNKRNILSVFTLDLENGNTDLGRIEVDIETKKKHKYWKKKVPKKLQEQIYGIYNGDDSSVIRYCDTLPTW